MDDELIYKICSLELWDKANQTDSFTGAPVDEADGFIHFSTASQLAETAAKHFAGQHDLVLLTVAAHALGAELKWEPSRGGDLFPHLYGVLKLESVVRTDPLLLDESGLHILPDEIGS